MSEYVKKIINLLSKSGYSISDREDLMGVYALSEDEYVNDFIPYEVSLLNKLSTHHFHTVDYDNTGSYDFHFGLENGHPANISQGYEGIWMVNLYVTMYEGTVELGDRTTTINSDLIANHKWGWEVELEINDIVKNIIMGNMPELIKNTDLLDIVNLYIEYPD